jgi:hypothetical protein
MSKEMREHIDRVKNWKQFLNENLSDKFELTQEMKDVIDFEKKYHTSYFDSDADELDRDLHSDDFYRDVFDSLEVKNLLPKDYDYYEVKNAISDYAHS